MRFISDCVQEKDFLPGALNMIVSGCGSGKSSWAAHSASFFTGIKPSQILFVTSRALTVRQQAIDYQSSVEPFYIQREIADKVAYWHGDESTPPDGMDRIQLMTYHAFAEVVMADRGTAFPMENVRVVIFDELHALIADRNFAKGDMSTSILAIHLLLYRSDVRVVGMTATPSILKCAGSPMRGINFHNVLQKPIFPYHVKKMTVMTHKQFLDHICNGKMIGRGIVMCNNNKMRQEIMDRYPQHLFVSSKENDNLNEDYMEKVRKDLAEFGRFDFKKVAESGELINVDLLIGTSTIREGFTMKPESQVGTVVCYEQDEMDIVQLVGRCRFDIEHLIVVYGFKYNAEPEGNLKTSTMYFREANDEIRCFVNKGDKTWCARFKNILAYGVEIENMIDTQSGIDEFLRCVSENYAGDDKKISRGEIFALINKAHELNAFRVPKRALSYDRFVYEMSRCGYDVVKNECKTKSHQEAITYTILDRSEDFSM